MDYKDAVLTEHALEQLVKRQLTVQEVQAVIAVPDAIVPSSSRRVILQKRLHLGEPPREYLLRVIVETDRSPMEIVTVYRTSKISKYEVST